MSFLTVPMVPGESQFGKIGEVLLDLRSQVENVLNEQQKALLKSQEQKKDLRKQLEKSEARNKGLERELEESKAQNKELQKRILDQHTALSSYEDQIKNPKKELHQVGSLESRGETMTKERDDLISKYNQALKQRDSALAKLNTIGAELNEMKDLELGKKQVWHAERIALAERLTKGKEDWEAEKIELTTLLTKERRDSTWKYNQALKERDTALNEMKSLQVQLKELQRDLCKSRAELESGKKELDTVMNELRILEAEAAELNEVRENLFKTRVKLELGKKVREAEKMELTKKLDKFGAEIKQIREELSDLAKIHEKHIQENENAYCAGYLTGWFREPHEYISPRSHEAKEVTLQVHKPLEATYSHSHSLDLVRRFGSAGS